MKQFHFEEKTFLGSRMRELRLAFGFKQEDIAKTLNVSRSTYSYYETSTTRPDPAVLGKLADFYKVPIDAFYVADLTSLPDTKRLVFSDSGPKRRTSRVSGPDLSNIGELTPGERSLILFLRANDEFDAGILLGMLERREREKAARAAKEN